MSEGNFIKLEMAQMAIRGNRFDEGEKMIQELLFSNSLDPESSSIAWFTYGSSKFKRFIQNDATFEEIIYAMNKSYDADPNSEKTISDTFFSMTCSLIQNYSTIIYKCLEELKRLNQEVTINKIKLVGGVILGSVLDERNKYLKYAAYSYSVIKGIELIGNFLDNKSTEEKIIYCTSKLKQILSDINQLNIRLQYVNKSVLEDEILNNKTIQFIIESQNSSSTADKLMRFKNSLNENEKNRAGIIESSEIIQKMNASSLFSKLTGDLITMWNSHYKHLINNGDKILFGIIFKRSTFGNSSGFIIFLDESFVILNITLSGMKQNSFIKKISYSELNIGDITVAESMLSTSLTFRYKGEVIVYSCDKILNSLNQFFSI